MMIARSASAQGAVAPRALPHSAARLHTGRRSVPAMPAWQPAWLSPRHPSSGARRQPHLPQTAAGGGGGLNGVGGGGKGIASGGNGGSSSSPQGGGSGGLWGSYLKALETSPILTKALTSAFINMLGNLFAQLVVEGAEQLDWKRLAIFTAIGGAFVAPTLHFWYSALNKLVPAATTAGALMRMAVDQLGFAPIFTAAMMTVILTCEGKSDQVAAQLKSDWLGVVKANWMLWVPVQFFNFRFVPVNFQVLVANVAAFFWGAYVSYIMRPKVATA